MINDITSAAGPSGVKCRKIDGCQAQSSTTLDASAKHSKEHLAQTICTNILNVLNNSNPVYAAFKASEIVLSQDPLAETNSFLNKALTRKDSFITTEKIWHPPLITNPLQSYIFESIHSKLIDEKVKFLVSSLPHVQPAFLAKIAKDLNGIDQKIEEFIIEICEGNRVVPLLKDGSKYSQIVEDFFTVQQFLEMYEDPINHFKNDMRVTDEHYRMQALNQLKSDFRFASVVVIRKTFADCNHHYTPTFLKMSKTKNFKDRKTKRSNCECYDNKVTDEFLLQEIAIVRIKDNIEAHRRLKEQNRLEAVKEAKTQGKLLDCPICCEDELIDSDFVRCSNGHGICRQCVKRQSEELIGQMKNHVSCLFPSCESEYSLKDLKTVLTKTCFIHLEKRRQAEEISAANIEGLESCPFCEYCEVPPENTLVFRCKNPECTKTSCRKCREPDHGQLSCEENAMKQRLASYVEMKMTEALVRECPSCKKKFVKLDGCNKMTCVCGTIICYICRAKIQGYKHFYNANVPLLPNQSIEGKCPLYSDTNKVHEEDVAKGAAQAKAELALQNPNVRVNLVLGKLK